MIYSEKNDPRQQKRGGIEVICGSMFSGKTEELIRRLKRANFAKLKVEIFKPTIDTRYSDDEVVSHDARQFVQHRWSRREVFCCWLMMWMW